MREHTRFWLQEMALPIFALLILSAGLSMLVPEETVDAALAQCSAASVENVESFVVSQFLQGRAF